MRLSWNNGSVNERKVVYFEVIPSYVDVLINFLVNTCNPIIPIMSIQEHVACLF